MAGPATPNLIEYAGHAGSFRNTTVEGAVNGMELHLGVIDDPIKGRAEASSKTVRDRTWNWFADDFSTRFAADSGLLMIMTRWHIDDPLGRLLERELGVRVVSYPALAEKPERYRKPGDALFPELKPLEFLLGQKKVMSTASWKSEYQQNPYQVGGGAIPIEKLEVIPIFNPSMIRRCVLSVDKAATEGGDGAFSCFDCIARHGPGRIPALDHLGDPPRPVERLSNASSSCVRRRRSSGRRSNRGTWTSRSSSSKSRAQRGKESAEATIKNLFGFAVTAVKVTGSKEVRASRSLLRPSPVMFGASSAGQSAPSSRRTGPGPALLFDQIKRVVGPDDRRANQYSYLRAPPA